MQTRTLRHLQVSAVGYGCMGLSHGYGPVPERREALRLIREAFELGCTLFDTAEGYSAGDNEVLVGEALLPIRDQVVMATKLRVHAPAGSARPDVLKDIETHVDASLQRLGTDRIARDVTRRKPWGFQPQCIVYCPLLRCLSTFIPLPG